MTRILHIGPLRAFPTIPLASSSQHAAISGCTIVHRARAAGERFVMPPVPPGRFQQEINFVAACCAISDVMWSNGGSAIGELNA